jgi:hypothetical protein
MAAVTFHGPFFDERGQHFADELKEKGLREVAAQGYSDVMHHLNRSIRHPTPYYETQITVTADPPDVKRINDRGVIYGPWLEGVGSRNRTTRFKGYFSFRRALNQLRSYSGPKVLEKVIVEFLEKINGR